MNAAVIGYILQAFQIISALIRAGVDAASFIEQTSAALKVMQTENRNPTDAEWQSLDAQIASLRAKLQAPVSVTGP